jgi:hypothetical protein
MIFDFTILLLITTTGIQTDRPTDRHQHKTSSLTSFNTSLTTSLTASLTTSFYWHFFTLQQTFRQTSTQDLFIFFDMSWKFTKTVFFDPSRATCSRTGEGGRERERGGGGVKEGKRRGGEGKRREGVRAAGRLNAFSHIFFEGTR